MEVDSGARWHISQGCISASHHARYIQSRVAVRWARCYQTTARGRWPSHTQRWQITVIRVTQRGLGLFNRGSMNNSTMFRIHVNLCVVLVLLDQLYVMICVALFVVAFSFFHMFFCPYVAVSLNITFGLMVILKYLAQCKPGGLGQ